MRRASVPAAVLAAVALAWGCSDSTGPDPLSPTPSLQAEIQLSADVELCGEAATVELWAGQHIDAGDLIIGNDGDNLYVSFEASGDWMLAETHLHVGDELSDIPATKKHGNPIPGKFDYGERHDPPVSYYTYVIPLEDLPVDGEFVVAAHAVVVQLEAGEVVAAETAWGGDVEGDSKRWWYYSEYTVQECVDPSGDPDLICETAFAFADGFSTTLEELGFTRWGWQIAYAGDPDPLVAELWAGAGQNDLTKGVQVGTVSISGPVDGDLSVDYSMFADFGLYAAHVYVGPGDVQTSAPGNFGNTAEDLDGAAGHPFTIDVGEGAPPLNVVAHAEVCWPDVE